MQRRTKGDEWERLPDPDRRGRVQRRWSVMRWEIIEHLGSGSVGLLLVVFILAVFCYLGR